VSRQEAPRQALTIVVDGASATSGRQDASALRDVPTTEDLTQQVFVSVYANPSTLLRGRSSSGARGI
jgi:hypothetical protein